MPTGITNRDFCNQRAWRATKDKGKPDSKDNILNILHSSENINILTLVIDPLCIIFLD